MEEFILELAQKVDAKIIPPFSSNLYSKMFKSEALLVFSKESKEYLRVVKWTKNDSMRHYLLKNYDQGESVKEWVKRGAKKPPQLPFKKDSEAELQQAIALLKGKGYKILQPKFEEI
jgi:hypothetical protein